MCVCKGGGGVVTQGEYYNIYRARKEKNEIPKTINVITRDKGKFEVTAQCLQPIHSLIWDFLYILKDVYRWSGNSV